MGKQILISAPVKPSLAWGAAAVVRRPLAVNAFLREFWHSPAWGNMNSLSWSSALEDKLTRKLAVICGLCALLVLLEEGLAAYSDYAERKADKEARQFVGQAIPAIAANWDEAVFHEYSVSHVSGFSDSQLKRFRQLGKLTHYYSVQGHAGPVSFPAFPWTPVFGFYTAEIVCEHGTARVKVAVAQLAGAWKIEVFGVPKASVRLGK